MDSGYVQPAGSGGGRRDVNMMSKRALTIWFSVLLVCAFVATIVLLAATIAEFTTYWCYLYMPWVDYFTGGIYILLMVDGVFAALVTWSLMRSAIAHRAETSFIFRGILLCLFWLALGIVFSVAVIESDGDCKESSAQAVQGIMAAFSFLAFFFSIPFFFVNAKYTPGASQQFSAVGTASTPVTYGRANEMAMMEQGSYPQGVAEGAPSYPPTRPEVASILASNPRADPILAYIGSRPPTNQADAAARKAARLANVKSLMFDFKDITVKSRLGMGSFGQVFLALWHETPVALKVLMDTKSIATQTSGPKELSSTEASAVASASPDALLEEATIMATLRHPNVVQFLGFSLSPPCIATEYLPRGSLYDVMVDAATNPETRQQLTWRRTVDMAIGAAMGMLHLHTRSPQVIHRDLKSANLLVASDWTVKVADFNLSKLVEGAMRHSMATTAGGASNPRWLAPELFEDKRATAASDVYSFGIVMWEMLTWQLPWTDANPYVIPGKVLANARPELPAPATLPMFAASGQVPAGLAKFTALMQRCWAQDPAARPDFQAVIGELRQME